MKAFQIMVLGLSCAMWTKVLPASEPPLGLLVLLDLR